MEPDRVPPCSVPSSQNHIDGNYSVDSKVPKVHVNPNFRNGQSLVIHVNPKMHRNRKIHVNPKMMKDIVPAGEMEIKPDALGNIDEISRSVASRSEEKQKNIHVNPKMMKKLSSVGGVHVGTSVTSVKSVASVDCGKTRSLVPHKISSNISSVNKSPCKITSPRLMSISRRKLVRIGTNTKITAIPSPSSLKRLKGKSLTITQVNAKKITNPRNLSKFNQLRNKYKTNAYKIDRTVAERRKRKKICIPDARIQNVNKGLVAIGGVMYQSSRTQLVRSGTSGSSHKKKNCISNTKDGTFVMAKNGKKLQRLDTSKGGSNVTRYMISRNSFSNRSVVKKVPISIVQSSNKNVISFKAKQRSLQILRDKLRKNYIPCLLYRRFGYCAKYAKGTCPKLHDKKQVALCKNFLQGKCLLDSCPLSHDIGPEKMPTCKYFLEGCCSRDACPYLHVKVSPNTPVCAQFLRGYCADGNKCKQRHTYICPEYEKSGKCAKGKYCPYPHKLKSSVTKRSVGKNSRKSASIKRVSVNVTSNVEKSSEDTRKRYYDNVSDDQLAQMRESILKKMKCMKASLGIADASDNKIEECDQKIIDDDTAKRSDNHEERPRRAPIGPLPAYIPIN